MIRLIRPIVPDMVRVASHLADSFASGQLSNFGPAHRRLSDRLGASVLVSSGHTALMAAVDAVGSRLWAIPAFTFESTRLAVVSQGCEPVYVDVDPETGCMTPETLAKAGEYDAVMVVCPLSTMPNIASFEEVGRRAPVVVDAAATYGSPTVLAGIRAWCVSFHATKTFPIGEGGGVFGLSEEDRRKVESFVQFGFDANKNPSGRGLNAKLSDYAAAIGLALLDAGLDVEIEARLRNAAVYRSRLGSLVPVSFSGARTVYSTLPIFASSAVEADRIRVALRDGGIGHGQYYRPLVPLPNAVSCYERNICLPVHGGMSVDEIVAVSDVVKSAL